MKLIVNISRIIVGVLFIFSGLVKANDPAGLSYKMQEFFDVWSQNHSLHGLMMWLDNYALAFSITMITLEVVTGVAILIGWNKRFFSWLLLLLMIFFIFLTGFAVFSGKIKTCGCFGDCIPLTAIQSFIKDLILLLLILLIFFGVKYIRPLSNGFRNFYIVLISAGLVLSFQWYVLRHLPLVDCLPFKQGNNLLELRKMPANATFDKFDYRFVMEKNGVKKEFSLNDYPDSTWKQIERKEILIEKGNNLEAPIKDFVFVTASGTDTTEAILNTPGNYYLFFLKDIDKGKGNEYWLTHFVNLYNYAKEKNIPLIIVASQSTQAQQFFNKMNHYNVPVLGCDVTALKTAARTDPCLYLMKGPVVQRKWGWASMKKAIE